MACPSIPWLELVNTLAIVTGVFVAVSGITAWRREFVGRRRIELAEETLALFYEAADAIRDIRNPMSFSSEFEELERGKNEFEKDFEARKKASVVWVRYRRHSELFGKLQATRYRFMAALGKDSADPFNNIRDVINQILATAQILSREWAGVHPYAEPEVRQEWANRVRKFEAVFWEMSEDDEINTKVQAIVAKIEEACRPVIEGTGRHTSDA